MVQDSDEYRSGEGASAASVVTRAGATRSAANAAHEPGGATDSVSDADADARRRQGQKAEEDRGDSDGSSEACADGRRPRAGHRAVDCEELVGAPGSCDGGDAGPWGAAADSEDGMAAPDRLAADATGSIGQPKGPGVGKPGIQSYGGPKWELDHVIRSCQSGPCRTRRLPDYSKPLGKCSNYEIGAWGEELAGRYLEAHGYEILARNFRCSAGEADIVAQVKEGEAILIEVKSRYIRPTAELAMPEIAVDLAKQKRYRSIALLYIATHPECESVRFDVIAINMTEGYRAQLRHLKGAFAWDDDGWDLL